MTTTSVPRPRSASIGVRSTRPMLTDVLRDAIRVRGYSKRTESAYIAWTRRYLIFHDMRHPRDMGADEVTAFLTSLAPDVAPSTQNQARSALLFLYRNVLEIEVDGLDDVVIARRPRKLPVVLTRPEVRTILDRMSGPTRLMALLLYGAGLRIHECCNLRIKDIDLTTREITVRRGKGNKDRVTVLPAAMVPDLTRHIEQVRAQHRLDLTRGSGWVELPDSLSRKYPAAGREWPWQWVFPATRHYTDPRTGRRRRHHLHETVLQRAFRRAVLAASVAKHATPHTLRTHSPPTSSKTATTSAPSRNSSATKTSRPPPSTSTSSTEAASASGAPSIASSIRPESSRSPALPCMISRTLHSKPRTISSPLPPHDSTRPRRSL